MKAHPSACFWRQGLEGASFRLLPLHGSQFEEGIKKAASQNPQTKLFPVRTARQ